MYLEVENNKCAPRVSVDLIGLLRAIKYKYVGEAEC
jgi:hypothetical protein